MGNIISIIIAFVMMFSGIGAATQSMEAPYAVEAALTVNAAGVDALMADMMPATADEASKEAAAKTSKLIVDLLDGVTSRVVIDKGYLEYGTYKNGDALLTVAGQNDENGIVAVTSLLGETKLTLSNESAQQLMQMAMAQFGMGGAAGTAAGASFNPAEMLQGLDMEALQTAFSEAGQKFMTELMSKFSAPEQGSFEINGMTFSQKITINMTVKEFQLLYLQTAKEILENAEVQKLLAKLPEQSNPLAKIDEGLAAAQASTDESLLPATIYGNTDAADTYLFVEKVGGEDGYVGAGSVAGKTLVSVFTGAANNSMKLDVVSEGADFSLTAEMPAQTGKPITIKMTTAGQAVKVNVDYAGQELFFTETKEVEVTALDKLTEKTLEEFKVETLLAEETAEAAAQTLSGKMMGGIMTLMSKLMIYAGENAELLGQLLNSTGALGQ